MALAFGQATKPALQPGGKVDSIPDTTHAFIARFWLESRDLENARPIWRGVVEHVTSGERHYLDDLDEVKAFIAVYLQDPAV